MRTHYHNEKIYDEDSTASCQRKRCLGLVTGESIGQVASHYAESLFLQMKFVTYRFTDRL